MILILQIRVNPKESEMLEKRVIIVRNRRYEVENETRLIMMILLCCVYCACCAAEILVVAMKNKMKKLWNDVVCESGGTNRSKRKGTLAK